MLAVERLDPARHHREAFRSGNEQLDEWLRRYAHQNDARINSARTWVLVDDADLEDDGRLSVWGYYALSMHAVRLEELSDDLRDRRWPQLVPATLTGRLAVHREHQGQGLGSALLRSAIERIAMADEFVAMVLIVVDAIDDGAAAFYRAHEFRDLPGVERRLALRVADAKALLRD